MISKQYNEGKNRQHTSRKSIPGNATQGEGLRAHTQNPLLASTLLRVPTQSSGREFRPRTVILGEGGATTTQVVNQVAFDHGANSTDSTGAMPRAPQLGQGILNKKLDGTTRKPSRVQSQTYRHSARFINSQGLDIHLRREHLKQYAVSTRQQERQSLRHPPLLKTQTLLRVPLQPRR